MRVTGGWAPQVNDKGFIPLHVNKEKLLPFDASDAGLGRRRWHSSHRTRTVHHAEEFIPLISTVAFIAHLLFAAGFKIPCFTLLGTHSGMGQQVKRAVSMR